MDCMNVRQMRCQRPISGFILTGSLEGPLAEMQKAGKESRFERKMTRADFKVKLGMPLRCQVGTGI